MSGKETKMGGETSQGNVDVPHSALTDFRKRTIQERGGFPVAVRKRTVQMLYSAQAPSHLEKLYSTVEAEIIDMWNSRYIIDITPEEIKSFTTNNMVKEKMASLFGALDVKAPKIDEVPFILSKNTHSEKYYEPRMVSIGPYHHGRPNLSMMEKSKLKIVKLFLEEIHLPIYEIYSKIRREIRVLRKFYEENVVDRHFNDDKLAWTFFLDGCLILHYIHCAAESIKNQNKDAFQKWNIKPHCLTFVEHDLFLLENQLPYRVLEIVISCVNNRAKKIEFLNSIEDFISDRIKTQWEKHEKLNHKPCQNEGNKRLPKHLLDLLRAKILQSNEKSTKSCSHEPLEKIKDLIEYIGKALENFPRQQIEDLPHCRNVEELKAAGIRLKPNNTGCITDIDFNLGTLKIHPFRVDDTTASMLLNLIAYEMTSDSPTDYGISSYVAFLDSLIDRAQDVKELRDEQILRHFLGSDEEVARLFNEICINVVANPDKYLDVKKNIQKRYKNIWMTGIARLIHQYFQSPWSVIVFLATTAILTLTALQTVYTMKGNQQ